jgi:hypothetical protein
MNRIYCIWYPSGGFGHYISGVISLYGDNFIRPLNQLVFAKDGNSHAFSPLAPKWKFDPDHYNYKFAPDRNHCVLIDNGAPSQSKKFKTFIPNSTILKVTYNNWSFPIVVHTMIVKAMRSSLEEHCLHNVYWTDQDWGKRQKFLYFLKNHPIQNLWNPEDDCTNIDLIEIIDYDIFKSKLESAGIKLTDFSATHQEWFNANKTYIDPVLQAQKVMECINSDENFLLSHITDLWTQAVVYYYIWLTYKIEVEHHTMPEFFNDTNQIRGWLIDQGVL